MKAFILAAGVGSRLSKYSQNTPKCLLKVEGKTLIGRIVENLRKHDINEIVLVVGYKKDLIIEELGDKVSYIYNPFYPVTNSIASLWFAKDVLSGDALLLNADLFFEEKLLDMILREERDPVMFCDSSRILEADYKFTLQNEHLIGYGKDIPPNQVNAEYVGIAKIQSQFMPRFKQRLVELIDTQNYSKWWEDVLYSMIDDGIIIHTKDVIGTFWAEVDYVEDYERIQKWCITKGK